MAVLERSTDMVTLPGGTFTMGSDRFYPEEGPSHPVTVDAFRIDRRPVTVARYEADTVIIADCRRGILNGRGAWAVISRSLKKSAGQVNRSLAVILL